VVLFTRMNTAASSEMVSRSCRFDQHTPRANGLTALAASLVGYGNRNDAAFGRDNGEDEDEDEDEDKDGDGGGGFPKVAASMARAAAAARRCKSPGVRGVGVGGAGGR
jgi:hypothetical protein